MDCSDGGARWLVLRRATRLGRGRVRDGGVLDGGGRCVAGARRRRKVSASGGVDLVIQRRSRRSEGSNRRAAAARCQRLQYARSGRALGTHTMCSPECLGGLQ